MESKQVECTNSLDRKAGLRSGERGQAGSERQPSLSSQMIRSPSPATPLIP